MHLFVSLQIGYAIIYAISIEIDYFCTLIKTARHCGRKTN